jgi:hypothetical protein
MMSLMFFVVASVGLDLCFEVVVCKKATNFCVVCERIERVAGKLRTLEISQRHNFASQATFVTKTASPRIHLQRLVWEQSLTRFNIKISTPYYEVRCLRESNYTKMPKVTT